MKRFLATTVVALSLPLLAACASGGTPTGSVEAVAPTQVEPNPIAGPDIEGGDPFCDLAVDQFANATALEAKAGEITAMLPELVSGGNSDALNTWGNEMAALVTDAVGFYDQAIPMVDESTAQQAFVDMRGFVNDYSLGLAVIAQNSASGADFVTEMSEFIAQPEINAAMTRGPEAALEVRAYIDDRCGVIE